MEEPKFPPVYPTWVNWVTFVVNVVLAFILVSEHLPALALVAAFFAGVSIMLATYTPRLQELQRVHIDLSRRLQELQRLHTDLEQRVQRS